MNAFTLIFVLALALATGVQVWLGRRQLRHVAAHRGHVPEAFSERVSLAAHQRAADYTLSKTRFALFETLYGATLLLIWTLGGGLNLLDGLWRTLGLSPLATGVGFMISVFLIIGLLDLPLAVYRTFVIEQRFGFNRTTPSLFLKDEVKQTLLLLLLGAPLTALVLWLMGHSGEFWWLYAWAVWMAFGLVMMWAYPAVIAPLFNKFTPLADSALEQRIRRLLERCGFSFRGVLVMDGSRRSSHGNAYFTGLGNNKRIVFYDTLLKHLGPEEIEAVLAHELGHFRRRHVTKRFSVIASLSLVGLAVLGQLIQEPWFFTGLGMGKPSLHGALTLFLLVAPVFAFFVQPPLAAMMRRHEFEADDFAAGQSEASDLVHALVRLYEENAATLTPDPLYSAFHDSHPPAPVRIAHLSAKLP